MILRSLRLKNIKSYGEGADGNGVVIDFAPGINRIAGRNGHGKSTLIESLGYALFLAEPLYEENFDVATYLVRHGERAGEIDVTFEADGELYRIERGLGARNLRRAKVIVVGDGSTAAEGDREVVEFLCRVLRARDAVRLAEWFAKLIGIKQGRLGWPFDSKPGEARKHFEPLLDVEIFRDCFERLKPVADRFTELRRDDELCLATITEQLRERADSGAQVTAAVARSAGLAQQVASAKGQRDALAARVEAEAKKEAAWREAERLQAAAEATLKLAAQRHADAARRAAEARQAASTLDSARPAHDAHVALEQAEKQLHQQQAERARLNTERAGQQKGHTQFSEKTASALRQATVLRGQRGEKAREFDRRRSDCGKQRSECKLDAAQEAEKQAAWHLDEGTKHAAAGREKRSGLARQLEQIAGGVCPFLKEGCRQFDPAKVQTDLATFDQEISALDAALSTARAAHALARQSVLAETQLQTRLDAEEKALQALDREIALLEKSAVEQDEAAKEFSRHAAERATQLAELDRQLAVFGELDAAAVRLQHTKAVHAPGYRAFLAAKALAETAPAAEERLRVFAEALDRAKNEGVKCAAALEIQRGLFDATQLAAVRSELSLASETLATRTSELRHAEEALKLARKRHGEWQRATAEQTRLQHELDRRDAALALVEKARRILRDSAPRVAQHLCDRIAARAQRLFNQINHEPSELVWSAERYSLRIEPGDRRFAMLSGGEQTKLALAMTLAMIQEFSTLRFCLFDEPTYGVDADSREKLADAIVEAQKLSGFDQLLLVSHDDAFDGKIEHVVCVKKNAATGTAVEISD